MACKPRPGLLSHAQFAGEAEYALTRATSTHKTQRMCYARPLPTADRTAVEGRAAVSPLEQLEQLNQLLLSLDICGSKKERDTAQTWIVPPKTMTPPALLASERPLHRRFSVPTDRHELPTTAPLRRPSSSSPAQPPQTTTTPLRRTTSNSKRASARGVASDQKDKLARLHMFEKRNRTYERAYEYRSFLKSTAPAVGRDTAPQPTWQVVRSCASFISSIRTLTTVLVLAVLGVACRHTAARQTNVDATAAGRRSAIEVKVANEEWYACMEEVVCCKSTLNLAEKRLARAQHHLDSINRKCV